MPPGRTNDFDQPTTGGDNAWRFCAAPMMQRTDRHFRYLLRLMSEGVRLYTEMIPVGAILHGDRERFLAFDDSEHPVAVQFGGSDPDRLAECTRIATDFGYDEMNLNCGCPSDRVQSGEFGACMMAKPGLVADCVARMRGATSAEVTVKMRLGIDELYDYAYFRDFAAVLLDAGADALLIHARRASLSGLSPRENREVPPLRYDWVHRLKREFPAARIVLNGGIGNVDTLRQQLHRVDGAMIGRWIYAAPFDVTAIDQALFGHRRSPVSRIDVVNAYLPYVRRALDSGIYLHHVCRHLLNMFQGQPGAKSWRRRLTEGFAARAGSVEVLEHALTEIAVHQ